MAEDETRRSGVTCEMFQNTGIFRRRLPGNSNYGAHSGPGRESGGRRIGPRF